MKRRGTLIDTGPIVAILSESDQHHQRSLRLQPDEFDVFEAHIGFGGQHHRCGAGQAGQPRQSFAERRFDRLCPADRGELALDRLPVGLGEVADLHQGVDEEAQPQFGRQPAG